MEKPPKIFILAPTWGIGEFARSMMELDRSRVRICCAASHVQGIELLNVLEVRSRRPFVILENRERARQHADMMGVAAVQFSKVVHRQQVWAQVWLP